MKNFVFLFLFIGSIFAINLGITNYANGENISVGTWELNGFKMLYVFPEGTIQKIIADNNNYEYRIIFETKKDTKLEIILPFEIFNSNALDYFKENDYVFSDTLIGISKDGKMISFTYQVSREINQITLYGIDQQYFDPYNLQTEFTTSNEIKKEIFENDVSERLKTNQNTMIAHELTIKADKMLEEEPNNIHEIIALYDQAISRDPNYYDSWNGKQIALINSGQYDLASKNINTFDNTFGTESYLAKGQLLLVQGKNEEAILEFKKEFDNYPYYETLNYLVNDLFRFNLIDEARELILYAYKDSSDLNKGIGLQDFGFYEESIKFFDRSIQNDKENYLSYGFKADSLFYLGRYDESLKYSEIALSLNPDDATTYAIKADALQGLEKYDESIKNYKIAINLDPDFEYVYSNLSSVYSYIENFQLALDSINIAIKLNPENDFYHGQKGLILLEMKNYDEALISFNKALEINPEYPFHYVGKGMLYMQNGNNILATENFDLALKIVPEC